jgi:hypothetical protein
MPVHGQDLHGQDEARELGNWPAWCRSRRDSRLCARQQVSNRRAGVFHRGAFARIAIAGVMAPLQN